MRSPALGLRPRAAKAGRYTAVILTCCGSNGCGSASCLHKQRAKRCHKLIEQSWMTLHAFVRANSSHACGNLIARALAAKVSAGCLRSCQTNIMSMIRLWQTQCIDNNALQTDTEARRRTLVAVIPAWRVKVLRAGAPCQWHAAGHMSRPFTACWAHKPQPCSTHCNTGASQAAAGHPQACWAYHSTAATRARPEPSHRLGPWVHSPTSAAASAQAGMQQPSTQAGSVGPRPHSGTHPVVAAAAVHAAVVIVTIAAAHGHCAPRASVSKCSA